MPRIMLVVTVTSEVALETSERLMEDTMIAKKAESMATSTILSLFQSAYVWRIKKPSEETSDITAKNAKISLNIWHSSGFSFGVKARHRSKIMRTNGTYRTMIYKPFTFVQRDRSRNVHFEDMLSTSNARRIMEQVHYLFVK